MNKIWLIVQREYITRVRTRGFLLSTLLTPLVFGLFVIIQGKMISYKSDENVRIAVLDEGGFLKNGIPDERGVHFTKTRPDATVEALKQDVRAGKFDAVLRLPPLVNFSVKKQTVYFYSDKQVSPDINRIIAQRVESKIRDFKIDSLHLDRAQIETLDTDVSVDPEPIDKADDSASELTSGVAVGISVLLGIIMYMVVLIYGSIVMRSVMEEKTNRVVEVIMSSVKPFQLMLGKIIGSAGVGTTQLVIWAVLNTLIFIGVQMFFGIDSAAAAAPSGMDTGGMNAADTQDMFPLIMAELERQNWWYIIVSSILYFIGGYFLYASMFAALGSAVGDDMSDGQSMVFPLMMPIILAFLIVTSVVMRSPHSTLSVFASMFPLFSPIVMPGRLAFHPPLWQVALSLLILFATAVFFVWIAGRIYRVGILMYGKKVTFKEIGKWMFYR